MELNDRKRTVLQKRLNYIATQHKGHGCLDATNRAASATVEALRKEFPGLDDTALGAFAATYADMVMDFDTLTVHVLATAIDSTYQIYSLAACQLIGLYDPDKGLDEEATIAPDAEPSPAYRNGQYL